MFSAAALLSACSTLTPVPKTSAATAFTSGNYTLDKTHAALFVRISHFGVSSYVGRFNEIDASLDFDQTKPESASLRAAVQTASLDVNNESFAKTLIGPEWLDSGAYPEAVLVVDNVAVTGGNTGTASGELTLRGVTNPVSFDVQFLAGATNPLTRKYTVGFEAKAKIKRSDFGIDKFLSIAGDKFDFDTVEIEFNGEFQRSNN
jgi:polyisoprenoid-binding protein YceI